MALCDECTNIRWNELRGIVTTFRTDQQLAASAAKQTQAKVDSDITSAEHLNAHYEVVSTWAALATHHHGLVLAFEQRCNSNAHCECIRI